MLPVQPGRLGCTDEELRVVGVWTAVGHGEDPRPGVLQTEVLVSELGAVDGLAAGAVVVGEVPRLAHEVGDDAVEGGALVAEAFLSRAESSEVLTGLGSHVGPEFHHQPAQRTRVRRHLEIHPSGHCCL